MKDERLYILHMLEMLDDIDAHLSLGGKPAFFNNVTVRSATLRSLQLLTESCRRLSDATRRRMPEVPWQEIGAFRNILVHDYLGDIDLEKVWLIVETELPELRETLKKYDRETYGS